MVIRGAVTFEFYLLFYAEYISLLICILNFFYQPYRRLKFDYFILFYQICIRKHAAMFNGFILNFFLERAGELHTGFVIILNWHLALKLLLCFLTDWKSLK